MRARRVPDRGCALRAVLAACCILLLVTAAASARVEGKQKSPYLDSFKMETCGSTTNQSKCVARATPDKRSGRLRLSIEAKTPQDGTMPDLVNAAAQAGVVTNRPTVRGKVSSVIVTATLVVRSASAAYQGLQKHVQAAPKWGASSVRLFVEAVCVTCPSGFEVATGENITIVEDGSPSVRNKTYSIKATLKNSNASLEYPATFQVKVAVESSLNIGALTPEDGSASSSADVTVTGIVLDVRRS